MHVRDNWGNFVMSELLHDTKGKLLIISVVIMAMSLCKNILLFFRDAQWHIQEGDNTLSRIHSRIFQQNKKKICESNVEKFW